MTHFLSNKASFLLGFALVTAISFSLIGISFARLDNPPPTGANTTLSNLGTTSINASLLPNANNAIDIGAFDLAFKDLFVSGTAYISNAIIVISTSTGDIIPDPNNTHSLGKFGFAWKDFYASSTLFLGGTIAVDPFVVGSSTPKFIIKDSGNVGIGTSLPLAILDVRTDVGNLTQINIDGSGFNNLNNVGINFILADSTGARKEFGRIAILNQIRTAGSEIGRMRFFTLNNGGTVEAMTILGNKIGIATTTPAFTLDVFGTARFSSSTIGTSISSHGLGLSGDLFVSGKLEVDGDTFFDGTLFLLDDMRVVFGTTNRGHIVWNTTQTPDAFTWGTGLSSNSIVLIENADISFDFAHALQTNPTLFIQSANQSTTEWLSLTHDQTNGVIDVGTGIIEFKQGVMTDELATSTLAVMDIDWRESNQQRIILSQVGHTITFSNTNQGQAMRLILCQDGTGNRTVTTWDTDILWSGDSAPTLTTAADACDVLTFVDTISTGTQQYFGSSVLDF